MEIYCTRPKCPDPVNSIPFSNDADQQRSQQRFCSACAMPLILGGRFLPLQRLGSGSFGTTFLAMDLHSASKRQCVIKQLRPSLDLTSEQLEGIKEKFRREAEVLETLGASHSYIPSLYAYFELLAPTFWGSQPHESLNQSEQYFYLAQEYIKGHDLDQELLKKRKFSESDVIEILSKMLLILQFIHQHKYGVIHRDIKPSNIMRDSNGHLYLIDFGAVKQITTGMPIESSIVLGTPIFSPPEQKSQKRVDPSSDLYSLAVTILCLLSDYSTLSSVFDSTQDRWIWRSRIRVSNLLGGILDKMLQPIPKQRFQSASEVLAALSQENSSEAFTSLASDEVIELRHPESPAENPEELQKVNDTFESRNKNQKNEIKEQQLMEVLRQALLLGTSGWLLATALISFFGTTLAPVFWILVFGVFSFKAFFKTYSLYRKGSFFIVSLLSVSMVLLLFPSFWNAKDVYNSVPSLLLLALASSFLAFILLLLLQLVEEFQQ